MTGLVILSRLSLSGSCVLLATRIEACSRNEWSLQLASFQHVNTRAHRFPHRESSTSASSKASAVPVDMLGKDRLAGSDVCGGATCERLLASCAESPCLSGVCLYYFSELVPW